MWSTCCAPRVSSLPSCSARAGAPAKLACVATAGLGMRAVAAGEGSLEPNADGAFASLDGPAAPQPVGPRCSSAGSPPSQHFAAFRCWPSPLPLPASLELGLEKDLAAFCSQECFKGSWTEHKKLHKPSATEGWHYCTRRGQVRRGLLAAVAAACCC